MRKTRTTVKSIIRKREILFDENYKNKKIFLFFQQENYKYIKT